MTFQDLSQSLHALNRDQVFAKLGVESRRSSAEKVIEAVALLGVGALVGTGLGLLLAPRPGRELRRDLTQRLRKGTSTGLTSKPLEDGVHPT